MQEAFIDHQASHNTLQMQNFSSLSSRPGLSIGSASSRPEWPYLASFNSGQLSSIFIVQAVQQRKRYLQWEISWTSSSPEHPFPALTSIYTVLVTTLTILHGALQLLKKQTTAQILANVLCETGPKEYLTVHTHPMQNHWNTDTEKKVWQVEILLPNHQCITKSETTSGWKIIQSDPRPSTKGSTLNQGSLAPGLHTTETPP